MPALPADPALELRSDRQQGRLAARTTRLSCTPMGMPPAAWQTGSVIAGSPVHVRERGERRVLHLLREVELRIIARVPADRPRRVRESRGEDGVEGGELPDDRPLECRQGRQGGRQLPRTKADARARPASG